MPAAKKTVLKVNIHCGRCKKIVLKTVTKLEGINQVTADADKGTLTIIGVVDPVMIVKILAKAGRCAEIVTVGPPKPPEPPTNKLIPIILPYSHYDYKYVPYVYDQGPTCTIV